MLGSDAFKQSDADVHECWKVDLSDDIAVNFAVVIVPPVALVNPVVRGSSELARAIKSWSL